MATLEKRGDYWRAKVRRKGIPIQSRSFDTKAHAVQWARDVESEIDKGIFVDRSEAEKNTVRDVLTRYKKEITPLKRGASAEASRLGAMLRRPIVEIKISALSSMHIAKYRDARLPAWNSSTYIAFSQGVTARGNVKMAGNSSSARHSAGGPI